MNLYEIKQKYLDILNNLEVDKDGVVVNYDKLRELSGAFDDKAEAVACYIKSEEAMATALKAEIEALQERRKSHERKVENLKEYLATSMIDANKEKIETPKIKLSFRKSSSVNVIDESLIPVWYKEEVVEIKVNKKEIGETLKSGGEVPGCELVTKKNLQIK